MFYITLALTLISLVVGFVFGKIYSFAKFDKIIYDMINREDINFLESMFLLQKRLQMRVRNHNLPKRMPEWIPSTITSISSEIGEILEEYQHWKDWRKNPPAPDEDNLKKEVADLWHFVINLTLYLGYDWNDVVTEFFKKNKENHERQDNNY